MEKSFLKLPESKVHDWTTGREHEDIYLRKPSALEWECLLSIMTKIWSRAYEKISFRTIFLDKYSILFEFFVKEMASYRHVE